MGSLSIARHEFKPPAQRFHMGLAIDFKPDAREGTGIHEERHLFETRSNESQSELRSAEYPSRVLHHDDVKVNSR